jgi:cation diffusion facilitator family transporter
MNEESLSSISIPTSARVTVYSLFLNLFLVLGKLFCGLCASSTALLSDAVHSTADLFSTLIILIGVLLGEHHARHRRRFEAIASIILALILLGTAFGLGESGVASILDCTYADTPPPGILAILMAALSILCKVSFFVYVYRVAKRRDSTALRADAYHHLTDAAASLGTLLGISASTLGYPIFDPLATLVVSCFILTTAIGIFLDALTRIALDNSF